MKDWNEINTHNMTFKHVEEGVIEVTRKSLFSGNLNTMQIPATQGQVEYWLRSGEYIQVCLSWLSPDEREFLMTGATPEDWSVAFD